MKFKTSQKKFFQLLPNLGCDAIYEKISKLFIQKLEHFRY